MTVVTPSIHQLAAEASFQLVVAKEQLEWFGAIARAIGRDSKSHGGQDVQILCDLAKHLDETGIAGIESAIEEFQKIGETEGVEAEDSSHTSLEAHQ